MNQNNTNETSTYPWKAAFFSLAILVLLVVLDQGSKYWAVINLKGQNPIVLFEDVFELYYLENQGAALGIWSGKMVFLILSTIIILGLILYLYRQIPVTGRFWLLQSSLIILFAGAVGNMLDRILHQYVIDFLYFKLIDFPVFNVADIYVTVGTALFLISLFFVYSEKELEFWVFLKKKK